MEPAPPHRPPTAVLFLDFDGVLQTPSQPDWREMEHCAGLIALLDEIPELQVVVTSTHREGRSLEGIRRLLPAPVASRVVGSTRVLPTGRAPGGRQREIEEWVSRHAWATRLAAVDDEAHLFDAGCPWLQLTHPWVGWDEHTTERLRTRLGLA